MHLARLPPLSIVISTVGRPKLVLDCVRTLAPAGVPPEVEVLVVDADAEQPVDQAALAEIWPNSRVIRFPIRNMAKQRNEGVRQSRAEICAFLDDDCYAKPGWWPGIVEPFREPDVALVGGAIWRNLSPKLTSRRGGYVNWMGDVVQVTHRGPGAPREIDWAVGCNMAFRKDVFLSVGGLCEEYGIYDEDVDFGLKVKKAGWRVVFQPAATVHHYCSGPSRLPTKQTEFRSGRNRAMLLTRHYGLSARLLLFLLVAPFKRAGTACGRVLRAAATQGGHAAAYLAGVGAGMLAGLRYPPEADRKRPAEWAGRSSDGDAERMVDERRQAHPSGASLSSGGGIASLVGPRGDR